MRWLLCVQRNLCELFSLLTSERSLPAGGERASWFAGDKLKVALFSLWFAMDLSVAVEEGGVSFTWLARPIRPAKDNKSTRWLEEMSNTPAVSLSFIHKHARSILVLLLRRLKCLLNKQNEPDPGRAPLAVPNSIRGVRRATVGRRGHSARLRWG